MVGSTEWVEEYIPWLTSDAVAYINTDVAVSGPIPYFEATPDSDTIAPSLMKKVSWRGNPNKSLYDQWQTASGGSHGPLGSGSDYTSFLHRAGTSAVSHRYAILRRVVLANLNDETDISTTDRLWLR